MLLPGRRTKPTHRHEDSLPGFHRRHRNLRGALDERLRKHKRIQPGAAALRNYKGKTFYAYKDEKQGVAYVGGETEYQKYQKLSIERRIARDNYEAAQMRDDLSYRWYGAWGPPVYIIR
jgi:hypothetical protein